MPRKALVTGASGLLGRQVYQAFDDAGWDVVGTGFSRAKPPSIRKLDLGDATAALALLDEERPQVVIHCAANRYPDKCDKDPEAARALNVEATSSLAKATSSRKIFLIYISTDYVFPGTEGEAPYEADAPTSPPNIYGQTKLEGEQATLRETHSSHLGVVLRVPVLYGITEKYVESAVNTLVDTVQKSLKDGASVTVDDWSQRYPTNTEDVGRVCKDIATKYLDTAELDRMALPKVLQFTSEDRFTKYEICLLLTEVLGVPSVGLKPNKEGNHPDVSVRRPFDTHLSTKALKDLDIPIWTQDFKAWWRRELHAFRH